VRDAIQKICRSSTWTNFLILEPRQLKLFKLKCMSWRWGKIESQLPSWNTQRVWKLQPKFTMNWCLTQAHLWVKEYLLLLNSLLIMRITQQNHYVWISTPTLYVTSCSITVILWWLLANVCTIHGASTSNCNCPPHVQGRHVVKHLMNNGKLAWGTRHAKNCGMVSYLNMHLLNSIWL
jgi:hypothetical protein